MKNPNLTEKELKILEACQHPMDWGIACDNIKAARGGNYPEDWWSEVKLSGMMDRIMSRWGADSELRVTSISDLHAIPPDHD